MVQYKGKIYERGELQVIDYYAVLEVKPDASQETIKKSYRALIKKYHPDVTTFDKKYSEEKTNALNEAYSVLSDVDKRKDYDKRFFKKEETVNTSYNQSSDSSYSKTNTWREDVGTESSVIKSRVITVCNDYFTRLDNLVIFEPGHEIQNFNICEELSKKFLNQISYDYQYLLNYDLMHGEVCESVVKVFWKIALSYTWSNSYPKAKEYINMASTIIEPTSYLYKGFIKDRNQIIEIADKQRTVPHVIINNNNAFTRFLLSGIGNFILSLFFSFLFMLFRLLLPFFLIWLFITYTDGCMLKPQPMMENTKKIDIRNIELYPPNKRILEQSDDNTVIIKR